MKNSEYGKKGAKSENGECVNNVILLPLQEHRGNSPEQYPLKGTATSE